MLTVRTKQAVTRRSMAAAETSVLPELLEMFRAVVSEHRERVTEQQPTAVLPILLAGFEQWQGLLAEVIRAESGAMIVAADFVGGCDAGIDPESLAAVSAGVQTVLRQVPGLDLAIDGSFVSVQGVGKGADSTAQDALRGIGAALFHPDLRDSPLVTFVFDERPLDDLVADPLWDLLMGLPSALNLSDGRTFVVIAGDADLRIPRHCVGEPSVRFNVRETEILARRPMQSSLYAVNEVRRLAEDAPRLLVIFTGAGAAAHYGLPLGNQLRDRALTQWLGPDSEGLSFIEQVRIFYERLAAGGRLSDGERRYSVNEFAHRLTLERVLREEQHRENRKDSSTIQYFAGLNDTAVEGIASRVSAGGALSGLARYVQSGCRAVIVTVNFDQGLEEELKSAVSPYISEADFESFEDDLASYLSNGGPVPYVKLHGDIGSPKTIVANVDDTEAGLSHARLAALRSIREVVDPVRPWVYVGYSMRDLDVQPVLTTPDHRSGLVEWWVGPFVDPGVREFIEAARIPRWRMEQRNYTVEDRFITLTSEEFFAQLLGERPCEPGVS